MILCLVVESAQLALAKKINLQGEIMALKADDKIRLNKWIQECFDRVERATVRYNENLKIHTDPNASLQDKWMAADNMQSDAVSVTAHIHYTTANGGYFYSKVDSLWKSDAVIHNNYKNEPISGSEYGLQSTLRLSSAYESGYHNSDCGQSNDIIMENKDLLSLIIDAQKLCTSISMDRIPIGQIVKNLMPSIVETYLLDSPK